MNAEYLILVTGPTEAPHLSAIAGNHVPAVKVVPVHDLEALEVCLRDGARQLEARVRGVGRVLDGVEVGRAQVARHLLQSMLRVQALDICCGLFVFHLLGRCILQAQLIRQRERPVRLQPGRVAVNRG